jgi:hypothetical protein
LSGQRAAAAILIVVALLSGACTSNSSAATPNDSSTTSLESATPSPAQTFYSYSKRFKSDSFGQLRLVDTLDVSQFHTVNFELLPNSLFVGKATIEVDMGGVVASSTLGQTIDRFPLIQGHTQIHSYDVVAPNFWVWVLGLPRNKTFDFQVWIFLQ